MDFVIDKSVTTNESAEFYSKYFGLLWVNPLSKNDDAKT